MTLRLLVDVTKSLAALGFHKELPELTVRVARNAPFLEGNSLVSFSKTLAVISLKARSSIGDDVLTITLRLLHDHLLHSQHTMEACALADALLAFATLARQSSCEFTGHSSLCSEISLARLTVFRAQDLVKLLRAHRVLMIRRTLCGPASAEDGVQQFVPSVLERLGSQIGDLSVRESVRCLDTVMELRRRASMNEKGAASFFKVVVSHVCSQAEDLDARDIAYALQALSKMSQDESLGHVIETEFLQTLYSETRHHIPTLGLDDALRIVRAADVMAHIVRPAEIFELLAAEFVRDGSIEPKIAGELLRIYGRRRYSDVGFYRILTRIIRLNMSMCEPRTLATAMHCLVKLGLYDRPFFDDASQHIRQNMLAFNTQDCAICLWAFSKATHRDPRLFADMQVEFRRLKHTEMTAQDVSMVLWSLSKAQVEMDQDLLSILSQNVVNNCWRFCHTSLLVTCLSFSRLGFARQPVLAELYRSLYARLPDLSDSQLAFAFFLFSTSGIRDDPLLNRFIFECRQRLPTLHGQNLSNIILACFRTSSSAALSQDHDILERLTEHVMLHLCGLGRTPLLGVYLSAPSVLALSKEQSKMVMEQVWKHLPEMKSGELVRCLLATARADLAHRPFLLALLHRLRSVRSELSGQDVVSCIWAVHALGIEGSPRFLRFLGSALSQHARARNIPASSLRDVLPALGSLGFWCMLPLPLRHAVWSRASIDLRACVDVPPPLPARSVNNQKVEWRLPLLTAGLFRRKRKSATIPVDPSSSAPSEADTLELTGRTAAEDFIGLIRRL